MWARLHALVVGLNPIDGARIIAQPSVASLALLLPAGVVLACVAAALPARAAARAPVARSLKQL